MSRKWEAHAICPCGFHVLEKGSYDRERITDLSCCPKCGRCMPEPTYEPRKHPHGWSFVTRRWVPRKRIWLFWTIRDGYWEEVEEDHSER